MSMKYLWPLMCALGSVWLAASAPAAIYHVAQQVKAARDDNAGTHSRPWKTLAFAARRVKPGDTVIVHSGVYRESVELAASGTARAPITFRAAGGEQPVISGADEVRDWTRVDARDPAKGGAELNNITPDQDQGGGPLPKIPREWGAGRRR